MSKTIRVRIEGREPTCIVPSPTLWDRPLSAALACHGFVLNTRCGERGLCRGCEVETAGGLTLKACQVTTETVIGLQLHIPEKSLLTTKPSITVDFQPKCEFQLSPPFQRRGPGDLGLAIDLGTTTVVMALVNLDNGKILGKASSFNAQVRMGEDVLTRLQKCSDNPEALALAQDLVLNETLVPLWRELQQSTGANGEQLCGAVVAGNTIMLHLLLGEDPKGMSKAPFAPAFLRAQRLPHGDLRWRGGAWPAQSHMQWILLPGYSAFVGADLAAGWLASGMTDRIGPTLLIDLGTNGEMVLQKDGIITGCATAAGPAFEGTQLKWGTRAIAGAVSRLRGDLLRPDALDIELIGGKRNQAIGFCGSAYLDFLALGIESGLLLPSGRFNLGLARAHQVALVNDEFGKRWLLDPARPDGPAISEADIALLLQAKAAIAAGLQILLAQNGLAYGDIERVYLAGGFGLNIGINSAIRCGLLAGFSAAQIEVVGNSALGGAYICLLDSCRLSELKRATCGVRIIELNQDSAFEDAYIDHLALS